MKYLLIKDNKVSKIVSCSNKELSDLLKDHDYAVRHNKHIAHIDVGDDHDMSKDMFKSKKSLGNLLLWKLKTLLRLRK